jgi:cytochrome P450
MTLSNFGAGTETIGITLSAILHNIIQRPDLQVRLRDEIYDAWKKGHLTYSSEGIVKIGHVQIELKLLDATLRESMRLHPVVGVPFPRVVGEQGLQLGGVQIPSGVSLTVIFHTHALNIPNAIFVYRPQSV